MVKHCKQRLRAQARQSSLNFMNDGGNKILDNPPRDPTLLAYILTSNIVSCITQRQSSERFLHLCFINAFYEHCADSRTPGVESPNYLSPV